MCGLLWSSKPHKPGRLVVVLLLLVLIIDLPLIIEVRSRNAIFGHVRPPSARLAFPPAMYLSPSIYVGTERRPLLNGAPREANLWPKGLGLNRVGAALLKRLLIASSTEIHVASQNL